MDFNRFFLNGSARSVRLDCLSITHPNFTREYHLVRNAIGGITATIEDGTEQVFEEYPFNITDQAIRPDLDFSINVQLGDLGEIIPQEIDAIRAADGMGTRPTVIYRSFSSSDLTKILEGPYRLEMMGPAVSNEGTAFIAAAKTANTSATGRFYSYSDFPTLRPT